MDVTFGGRFYFCYSKSMLTVLIFIVVLGVLVLVHEFGHFITAKRAGMKVEEFGFGFPPKIFSIKKGETRYSLNLIPFGGFVKIYGEDGDDRSNPRSFSAKSAGTRSRVIVAGVVMNILLAFVLLSIGNLFGLRVGLTGDETARVSDVKIQITQVTAHSPAGDADLRTLDNIVGATQGDQHVAFTTTADTQKYIRDHAGQAITIEIERGSEQMMKTVTPRVNPPAGEGALGISLAATGIVKYPWYQALYRGAQVTGILFINTLIGYFTIIKNIFALGTPGADLTGPVGIAKITGQAARIGFTYLMQFTAIISINLAVLNVIPFPALDGGRLLFILVEKIKRSPLSKRVEGTANAIGFSLLIILMIYVTSKDIIRLF